MKSKCTRSHEEWKSCRHFTTHDHHKLLLTCQENKHMNARMDGWNALGNLLTTKPKEVSLSESRITHENVTYEHWYSVWLHRNKPTTVLHKAKQQLHHKVTSRKLATHEGTVHVSSRSMVVISFSGSALAASTQKEHSPAGKLNFPAEKKQEVRAKTLQACEGVVQID